MSHFYTHDIPLTKKEDMIKITGYIKKDIKDSGITEGIAIIHCPHTTAGITVNENADPDVVRDMLYGFGKTYPEQDPAYRHFEGNSHAHLKSSTIGASMTVIIHGGKLILGTWQDVYFCEFDGPRHRHFYVKIMEG
ncbi:MAG: secondary thiamine-phosphate synthase enzyme YjbQ [Lachnospiraceae bacterium]|nr:secondary thiamine-phosphate synthase enzyme YjbQ [Lachnospiraceae bacterium]